MLMRLADEILTEPIEAPPSTNVNAFRDKVRASTIVVADNVQAYLYALKQEEFDISKDFPCIAPPFASWFMEAKRPPIVRSEDPDKDNLDPMLLPDCTGVLFYSEKDRNGWKVAAEPIVKSHRKLVLVGLRIGIAINSEGEAIGDPVIARVDGSIIPVEHVKGSISLLWAFLLTISFMHCKNVVRQENTPPEKLSKARTRRHGEPLLRYTTLVIDPMRAVLESEGKASETGIVQALHICRGHFKSFSMDKPLFGKVSGRFWWPQHMRGNSDIGEVVKSYDVLGPDKHEGKQ